jgi:hypothetical protein
MSIDPRSGMFSFEGSGDADGGGSSLRERQEYASVEDRPWTPLLPPMNGREDMPGAPPYAEAGNAPAPLGNSYLPGSPDDVGLVVIQDDNSSRYYLPGEPSVEAFDATWYLNSRYYLPGSPEDLVIDPRWIFNLEISERCQSI